MIFKTNGERSKKTKTDENDLELSTKRVELKINKIA